MSTSTTGAGDEQARPGFALGAVTVVATLLGWSSVPLFITYLSHDLDTWTSNGWRYVLSAAIWAPVLAVVALRGNWPKGLWNRSLVPAIFNAFGQAAFAWSFYNIDAATATFGLRLQIVFVAIGAYLMFPAERALLRSWASWVGIGLLLTGIGGTLLFADRDNLPTGTVGNTASYALGVVLAIASGVLFAGYALSVRRWMSRDHPVVAFAAISQITSLILIGAMIVLGVDHGWSVWTLTPDRLGMLALSSIIGIALGHVFYYLSIARLGVAVTSGVMQLQPFCVAVGQLALFQKPLTRGQWVCGLLAVGGATLLLSMQWRLTRRPAQSP